jgi:hypothetical protein
MIIPSQENEWSCMCVMDIPSQENVWSCMCVMDILSQENEWSCMCVMDIDFYDLSIGCYNCCDGLVFLFFILSMFF